MSIIVRIPISGQFDGTSVVPDTVQFRRDSDGVYTMLDANGDALVNVGILPMSVLLAPNLVTPSSLLLGVSHDGRAAVTSLRAAAAVSGSDSWVESGPSRSCDPSSYGYAGLVLPGGDGSAILLDGNAAGAQEVVLDVRGVSDIDASAAMSRDAVAPSEASQFFIEELYIADILTANAFTNFLRWVGPTVEIDAISVATSAVAAAGDLVVTTSINGVAVTGGSVTVAVAAQSGIATPSAANVLNFGDIFSLAVAGGGNTAAGRATLSFVARPLT